MRAAAKANAQRLGPIATVEPAGGFNDFGEARLGVDQVLVTKTGETFHQGWCRILAGIDNPTRVTVDPQRHRWCAASLSDLSG